MLQVYLKRLYFAAIAFVLITFLFPVLYSLFACDEHSAATFCLQTFSTRFLDSTAKFVHDFREEITAVGTLLIACFTYTLWRATNKLWEAGEKQSQLTKEALIADKRAFVFAKDLKAEWAQDTTTNLYNWRFRPVWENSGDTPTRNMRLYSNCELRDTPLPIGFDFRETDNPGTGLLAPKSQNLGGPAPRFPKPQITPQNIVDAIGGRKFIYIWGWVRYYDVFPDTPEHITHFCWQLLPMGDPFSFFPEQPLTDPGRLSFPSCHHIEGNYADEDRG